MEELLLDVWLSIGLIGVATIGNGFIVGGVISSRGGEPVDEDCEDINLVKTDRVNLVFLDLSTKSIGELEHVDDFCRVFCLSNFFDFSEMCGCRYVVILV